MYVYIQYNTIQYWLIYRQGAELTLIFHKSKLSFPGRLLIAQIWQTLVVWCDAEEGVCMCLHREEGEVYKPQSLWQPQAATWLLIYCCAIVWSKTCASLSNPLIYVHWVSAALPATTCGCQPVNLEEPSSLFRWAANWCPRPGVPVREPDRRRMPDHREDHQPGGAEDFGPAGERLQHYLFHDQRKTRGRQVSTLLLLPLPSMWQDIASSWYSVQMLSVLHAGMQWLTTRASAFTPSCAEPWASFSPPSSSSVSWPTPSPKSSCWSCWAKGRHSLSLLWR